MTIPFANAPASTFRRGLVNPGSKAAACGARVPGLAAPESRCNQHRMQQRLLHGDRGGFARVADLRHRFSGSRPTADRQNPWSSNSLLASGNGRRRGVQSFEGERNVNRAGLSRLPPTANHSRICSHRGFAGFRYAGHTRIRGNPRALMTYLIAVFVNQVWVGRKRPWLDQRASGSLACMGFAPCQPLRHCEVNFSTSAALAGAFAMLVFSWGSF